MRCIDFSRRNPYYPIDESGSIKDVVNIFLKGPHRIAITNQHNKIVSIVSQSDLIRWLAKDTTSLGFAAEQTAKQIMKKVISVSPNSKAIEAFRLMSEKNLTSIAIVDNEVLVGVLSAADLKVCDPWRCL
jgi:CBS-domain-containing membrane protein